MQEVADSKMGDTDDSHDRDDALDLTDAMPKRRRKSLLVRFVGVVSVLLSLLFLGLVAAAAGVLWIFWTYGKGLPDYHQLAQYEPPVATRIHAGNGALIAEHAREKRVFMPVEAMPPRLIQAFLSAEDKTEWLEHLCSAVSDDALPPTMRFHREAELAEAAVEANASLTEGV